LEQELKKDFKADIELIPGSNGIFVVVVDGRELFSKKTTKRFPNPGEITSMINSA